MSTSLQMVKFFESIRDVVVALHFMNCLLYDSTIEHRGAILHLIKIRFSFGIFSGKAGSRKRV